MNEVIHDLSEHQGPLRIGVLSDTHGEISQRVLNKLQGNDVILHAGDVCGQPVLDALLTITTRVIAVCGNNDSAFDYNGKDLPDVVHLKVPGGQISIVHGHQFGQHVPSHDAMREAYASSRAVIYGHSHKQIHDVDAVPAILNPGAAGSTRTNGGASCAFVVADRSGDWDFSLYRKQRGFWTVDDTCAMKCATTRRRCAQPSGIGTCSRLCGCIEASKMYALDDKRDGQCSPMPAGHSLGDCLANRRPIISTKIYPVGVMFRRRLLRYLPAFNPCRLSRVT